MGMVLFGEVNYTRKLIGAGMVIAGVVLFAKSDEV